MSAIRACRDSPLRLAQIAVVSRRFPAVWALERLLCPNARRRVDYLPGRALVEVRSSDNGNLFCYLVTERFGQRVEGRDVTRVACDF